MRQCSILVNKTFLQILQQSLKFQQKEGFTVTQQTQSLRKMNFGGDTVYGKTKEEARRCITTSSAGYKPLNYDCTVVYFIPADM